MASSAPAPLALDFKRSSVAEQTAEALGRAIDRGKLVNPLPGELELARRLGVGRPSIRAALVLLARQGKVEVHKGRRTRLASSRGRKHGPDKPLLCLVSPSPQAAYFPMQTPVILHLHAEAVSRGFEWIEIHEPRLRARAADRHLQRIVEARPNACWILHSCPDSIQHWFSRTGTPAFVLGTCAPHVSLPSVDLDFRSVGWHAAGAIARHRHRRIALVMPDSPRPGDLACRDGFLAQVARQRSVGIEILPLQLRSTARVHLAQLRPVLTDEKRPTALFTMREANTLALYTYLLSLGLRVPEDVSLVARDTHPLLESALPHLTRYESSPLKLAISAIRVARTLLSRGDGRPRPRLVTPQFIAGATLGPAPGQPVGKRDTLPRLAAV